MPKDLMSKYVSCWNKQLDKILTLVKQLGSLIDLEIWENYRNALSKYNKGLRKSINTSWSKLCE